MTARESNQESRPLKAAATRDIEAAIAAALSKLAGAEYEVRVQHLDFEPTQSADAFDASEMKLHVSRKRSSRFFGFPDSSEAGDEPDEAFDPQ